MGLSFMYVVAFRVYNINDAILLHEHKPTDCLSVGTEKIVIGTA